MSASQNKSVIFDGTNDAPTTAPISVLHQKNTRQLALATALASPIRITHHPKAGLNPVSDAAAQLFSILGKLKDPQFHKSIAKLQKQLIREVNLFVETLHHHGYSKEYSIVCRYIICSAFDDIVPSYVWGKEWNTFLLSSYKQDLEHQDKFFLIMDRAIKEPDIYIELMEMMYLCLTLGYKGRYRSAERELQLDQVISNLYKHIRAYRGSFSKKLSPAPLKPANKIINPPSLIMVFFITSCVIMSIFVVFGFLMDTVTNDAYDRIKQIEAPVFHETSKQ